MKLNRQQFFATTHHKGPMLIIAGAGTGKTSVITQKIVNILQKKLAQPNEILAVTFTNKAAKEMQDRVESMLPLGTFVEWIVTFHSLGDRLLKEFGVFSDVSPMYKQLDSIDAVHLVKQNLKRFSLSFFKIPYNQQAQLSTLLGAVSRAKDELIMPQEAINQAVEDTIIELKNNKLDPNAFLEYIEKRGIHKKKQMYTYQPMENSPYWHRDLIKRLYQKDALIAKDQLKSLEFARFYVEYEQLKQETNSIDFGDLLFTTIKMIDNNPNIAKKLHNRFKYILVDEFQDTNYAQYVLIKKLTGNDNITVVGDDDQSIYSFRGATIDNILNFTKDYPNAKIVTLTQNYRSMQNILDLAYKSIKNNTNRLETTQKISKKLASNIGKIGTIAVTGCLSPQDEAEYIVKKILKLTQTPFKPSPNTVAKTKVVAQKPKTLLQEKIKLSDIAILARSVKNLESIMRVLLINRIPFTLHDSSNLLRKNIIIFMRSYLQVLNNLDDNLAFWEILRSMPVHLHPRDLNIINNASKRQHLSIRQYLEKNLSLLIGQNDQPVVSTEFSQLGITTEAINKISKLFSTLGQSLIEAQQNASIASILYNMLENYKYIKYLLKQENIKAENEIRDIQAFLDLIQNFEYKFETTNIAEILDYLDTKSYQSDVEDIEQRDDSVNILSIHKAKGLEFNTVFIVGLEEETFPGRKQADASQFIPPKLRKIEPIDNKEEERRLFYVAVTRAKEELYMSYTITKPQRKRELRPSTFLLEVLPTETQEIQNYLKTAPSQTTVIDQQKYQTPPDEDEIIRKVVWQIQNNNISYSKIWKYQKCPYAFKLQYIFKAPSEPATVMLFGSLLHKTLEIFYQKTEEDIIKIYNQLWDATIFPDEKEAKIEYDKGKEMLQNYVKKIFDPKTRVYSTEKNFRVLIDKYVLVGKVDRIDIIKTPNEVEIIDYKTSKGSDNKARKLQLYIYALALSNPTYGFFPKRLTNIYLSESEKETIELKDKSDLEKIRQEVVNEIKPILDKIAKFDFAPTPSKYTCVGCEFREVCEYKIT